MRIVGRMVLWACALAVACGGSPAPSHAPEPEAMPPPAPAPPASTPEPPAPAPSRVIVAGPFALEIETSRTAQLFHAVDQLSRWSPMCHPQYARAAIKEHLLDDADRASLAKHATLRRVRGWGSGFEPAFYVKADLDDASQTAIDKKLLTEDEAHAEHDLLTQLAPKIDPWITRGAASLEAFDADVRREAPRAGALADKVARFADVTTILTLSVFPVVDPIGPGGARYGGERIVVEIADGVDPMTTFEHELFRAVLLKRRETIALAASKCKQPIDDETLMEAIAYALVPGILHGGAADDDPLARAVAADRAAKRNLRRAQARFRRLGLALRTPLQSAIEAGDGLSAFLPKACDAWKKVARE